MKPKFKYSTLTVCLCACLSLLLWTSCTISYKLNGASIDYQTTKTISFETFPIKAALVYAPLAANFNDALQAKFANQTRLQQVRSDGDLQLSGAITGYTLSAQAIQSNAYASMTRLTIRIKVKFVCKPTPTNNFEKEFSAFRDFDATLLLNDVQDDLCNQMIEELVENIFNATVANW